MRDSEILGRSTELECQLAFTKLNIVLSQPITPDSRYDYIADINNKLYKIQCKSSILDNDGKSIIFGTKTTGRGAEGNYQHCYTEDEVDFFYTCYNGISYLVPLSETGRSCKTLRFESDSNNPSINWAKDYELSYILKTKLNYEFDNSYLFDNRKKQSENELNHCIDCGVTISPKATRCNLCAHKLAYKTEHPNREELKNMIRTMPFTTIANQYGVSDKAVSKWCIAENLPSRKTDIKKITDEEWEKL